MKRMTIRNLPRNLQQTLIVLLVGTSYQVLAASRDVVERTDASPTGQVSISNTSGDISVFGWDNSEVLVSAELDEGAELEVVRNGDRVSIEIVRRKGSRNMGEADLDIQVPRDSELSINSVNSEIESSNVRGVQRLQVVSGDITAEVFADDIEIKTVSGDVRIKGHGESNLVTVTTLSGNGDIANIAGELETTTISGDITVTAGDMTRARLKATNGDIEFGGSLAPGGRFESETLSGDVELQIAPGDHLDVDIETFSGDIDNCFGVESERKSEYGPGRHLRFARGDGDRTVRVRTMNGDAEVCDR